MLSPERNQELEISKGDMSLLENSRKNLINRNSSYTDLYRGMKLLLFFFMIGNMFPFLK